MGSFPVRSKSRTRFVSASQVALDADVVPDHVGIARVVDAVVVVQPQDVVVLGGVDRAPQLDLELLAAQVEHDVAADEGGALGLREDRVELCLGVVLLGPERELKRQPGEARVRLQLLHPPGARLLDDREVLGEDGEDGVATPGGGACCVEPGREALSRLRGEAPELLRPLVLPEEAVVRVQHLVEDDLARESAQPGAGGPRLRPGRSRGEAERQVDLVVEDADLGLHADALRAQGARLADQPLELEDALAALRERLLAVGPLVGPEGGAQDRDRPRGGVRLAHRGGHRGVHRRARRRLPPGHVDLGVAEARLAHVRLERDLQAEVPGVPAPGEPVDAELGAVAEDPPAAQRHGEREDERGVLALEVVVDSHLQEERAQLRERPDAAVHAGEAGVAPEVGLAARPDPDDRGHQVLVDADERPAPGEVLVPAAVEPEVAPDERLPHERLPQRARRDERVRRGRRGLGTSARRTGDERAGQDRQGQDDGAFHGTLTRWSRWREPAALAPPPPGGARAPARAPRSRRCSPARPCR